MTFTMAPDSNETSASLRFAINPGHPDSSPKEAIDLFIQGQEESGEWQQLVEAFVTGNLYSGESKNRCVW